MSSKLAVGISIRRMAALLGSLFVFKGKRKVDGLTVQSYTLERITGEKMRAYLTSLPVYRSKIGRRPDTPRFKDLYDLARIRRRFDLADNAFWRTASREFGLACESRFVDCAGNLDPDGRTLYKILISVPDGRIIIRLLAASFTAL